MLRFHSDHKSLKLKTCYLKFSNETLLELLITHLVPILVWNKVNIDEIEI